MKILRCVVGPVQTNCYIPLEEDGSCLVVDPGDNSEELVRKIREAKGKPLAVLLTHGHFDHAGAAGSIASIYHVPIIACEKEKDTLEDPEKNASWMVGRSAVYSADQWVKDEEVLTFGPFTVKVLETPGHTAGGCCYYLEKDDTLFSGDTLFQMSVGRSDLPGGDGELLVKKIREKLLVLKDQTLVCPGHGNVTTIENEKRSNRFIRE